MDIEKEILLQLLLEKYGITKNVEQPKPQNQPTLFTNGKRRRGRNVPAVYSNARWTLKDLAIVYDMFKRGLSNHEIAQQVGRSVGSVQTLKGKLLGHTSDIPPVVRQFLASKQTN